MTETSTRPSGRVAAAAAAKAMLTDRIKLVETLGDTLDAHQRKTAAVHAAQEAERGAADAARAVYTAALHGGWSASELKAACLQAPKAPRGRRSPQTQETSSHADSPASAGTAH